MKIAIIANTPAQLHFFKNILRKLHDRGHSVRLLVRDNRETIIVAKELGLNYKAYSKSTSSKIGKIIYLPYDIFNAYRYLNKLRPDIISGMGVYDAFTSRLLGARCIVFDDTEPMLNRLSYSIQFKLYLPFVDKIITPECFMANLGKKQIRVNSFKELAYLHPNYYKPDPNIKKLLGLKVDEEYVLLRFNAFNALHDFRIEGFSAQSKIQLVNELVKYIRVFISSESDVPDEMKKYTLEIPKSKIHDVIYYAKFLVADTGTMVTEAACLGTPAIILHSGVKRFGNFLELEDKYNLVFGFDRGSDRVIEKAIELLKNENLKKESKISREKLLNDKIDMTNYMVNFLENYFKQIDKKI